MYLFQSFIKFSGIICSTGVQIGEMFWIFGGTLDFEHGGSHEYLKESVLYHIRKKTWVKGKLLSIHYAPETFNI